MITAALITGAAIATPQLFARSLASNNDDAADDLTGWSTTEAATTTAATSSPAVVLTGAQCLVGEWDTTAFDGNFTEVINGREHTSRTSLASGGEKRWTFNEEGTGERRNAMTIRTVMEDGTTATNSYTGTARFNYTATDTVISIEPSGQNDLAIDDEKQKFDDPFTVDYDCAGDVLTFDPITQTSKDGVFVVRSAYRRS